VFGFNKRNVPYKLEQKNQLPQNAMSSAAGDAGRDGYTACSTADRETGLRPNVGGVPVREHPRDWLL
jgi:hypothetical protein